MSGHTLETLRERCQDERARFFAREAFDSRYCLEIINEALRSRDALYWEAMEDIFMPTVRGWINNHSNAAIIVHRETLDGVVRDVFVKLFIRCQSEDTLAFSSVAAAMGFMRLVVNSVMLDHRRVQPSIALEEVEEPIGHLDPSADAEAMLLREEIRKELAQCLPDPLDYQIANLYLLLEYRPREIADEHGYIFGNREEVRKRLYRVLTIVRRTFAAKRELYRV